MLLFISYLSQGVFLVVVAYFAVYVLLELRVLLISRKVEKRQLTEISMASVDVASNVLPRVSVLLPICNEADVVERLIDAACRLRYPAGLLEILVLDDSSDTTSILADAKVAAYARERGNIRLIRRQNREGYKAGNLVHGIQQATGDFYAIFDADFVPPADFLLKTIPCFADSSLGFLQTGIGYENSDVSFLTRFQAMEMGHQQYVTVGLCEDGDMASLSGSSCVWRKTCVEQLGGWNASTITEDVDLGYRAQLEKWKYAYLRTVISMSVLPETISAFRIQRERWGRGLIHSAFKHVRQMFRQEMPLLKRLHAISMMFSAALLASIYVLIVLSLPLSYLVHVEGAGLHWLMLVFSVLVAVWALDNVFAAQKSASIKRRRRIWHTFWDTYRYVAMFLPMAWYYFVGGVRALLGVYDEFNRTPKGKTAYRAAMPAINTVLLAGEAITFCYSLLAIAVATWKKNYLFIPFNINACLGFAMVLYWSWQERLRHEED
ncbi:glycosyltransferase [Leeia oryzae]|uniref:glycosyltransferase n=1 Tax=Leeia oryzae TaxID=356662 RepID=UPI000375B198|nr:glycosyltransferase [Leeia oryzae]